MVCLQEARRFAALSEQMLMRRQQKQRRLMLHWWHLVAQDLHHHRCASHELLGMRWGPREPLLYLSLTCCIWMALMGARPFNSQYAPA